MLMKLIDCQSYKLYFLQGFPFEVVPSQFEEGLDKSLFPDPRQYALKNSREKAAEVAGRLQVIASTITSLGMLYIPYIICDFLPRCAGSAGLGSGGRSRHYCGGCGLASAVCVCGTM